MLRYSSVQKHWDDIAKQEKTCEAGTDEADNVIASVIQTLAMHLAVAELDDATQGNMVDHPFYTIPPEFNDCG